MILSPLVHRLLEAQTIYSSFGIVILALQPFATPFLSITSHPLAGERLYVTPHLICHTPHSKLHTPHPTDAALYCASKIRHFPPSRS